MTPTASGRPRRMAAVLLTGLVLSGALSTGAVVAPRASAVPGDSWYFDAFGVPDAHQQVTGAGVTVAVIDQGYDPAVPDLQGARVEPGADTCRTRWLGPQVGFRDGILPDVDPQMVQADPPHGEHASSMAALIVGTGRGTGPGGTGVRGIAPDATVRMYSIGSREACNNQGGAVSSAIAQAVMDGADVISISHGIGGTPPDEAVRYAVDSKVPVVWASGNDGALMLTPPDSFEEGVVWVGAVDQQGVRWPKSNHGDWLTVVAPGVDVPAGGYGPDGTWDSTIVRTGTSGSAPIVAGLLALVMQKHPDATGNQVIQHLVRHTTREGETTHDPEYGFGIPGLGSMLAEDPTVWQDVNPLALVDRSASELPSIQSDEQALAEAGDAVPGDAADGRPEGATRDQEPGPQPGPDGARGPWPWFALGGGVLVLAGLVVLVRRRPGHHGSATGDPTAPVPTVAGGPATDTPAPPARATTEATRPRETAAGPAARPQGE